MDILQKEVNHFQNAFDLQEVVKRAIKYLIEGGAVAVAAYYIPQGSKLGMEEIALIAITAAATFALLDMYAPSIGHAARQGTGFGIGANMAGFPRIPGAV